MIRKLVNKSESELQLVMVPCDTSSERKFYVKFPFKIDMTQDQTRYRNIFWSAMHKCVYIITKTGYKIV